MKFAYPISGQTFSCEPFAVPTGCPLYYDCSVSNTSGVFVCCQQALISTTPTAPLKIVMGCPIGWNPFQSEIDGSFRFCLNSFDMRYAFYRYKLIKPDVSSANIECFVRLWKSNYYIILTLQTSKL